MPFFDKDTSRIKLVVFTNEGSITRYSALKYNNLSDTKIIEKLNASILVRNLKNAYRTANFYDNDSKALIKKLYGSQYKSPQSGKRFCPERSLVCAVVYDGSDNPPVYYSLFTEQEKFKSRIPDIKRAMLRRLKTVDNEVKFIRPNHEKSQTII